MSFKNDITLTPDISTCYRPGLRGVKTSDKKYFQCRNTSNIEGSVDIDSCLASKYPNENRWDYVIGYDDQNYFIEIHPASTSNISEIIAKKNWLMQWLRNQRSPLLQRSYSFHWIATGKVNIRKGSPQMNRLSSSGIKGPKKLCKCSF